MSAFGNAVGCLVAMSQGPVRCAERKGGRMRDVSERAIFSSPSFQGQCRRARIRTEAE